MKSLQFTVQWPLQGYASFRTPFSELVLSDVYWQWIHRSLLSAASSLPFVRIVEDGFADPERLVETIPVSAEFLELLRKVDPASAPPFDHLIPSVGSTLPSARGVLDALTAIVEEALASGTIEMELD